VAAYDPLLAPDRDVFRHVAAYDPVATTQPPWLVGGGVGGDGYVRLCAKGETKAS